MVAIMRPDLTYREGKKDLKDGWVSFFFIGDITIPKGTRIITNDGRPVVDEVGDVKRVLIHPEDINAVVERNRKTE
jgi:hypothetical protein